MLLMTIRIVDIIIIIDPCQTSIFVIFYYHMEGPFLTIYWIIAGLFILGCFAIYYLAPFTQLYWTIFATIWMVFFLAGTVIWFLAPNVDNTDATKAIRQVLVVCFGLGLLIVIFSIIKFAIK